MRAKKACYEALKPSAVRHGTAIAIQPGRASDSLAGLTECPFQMISIMTASFKQHRNLISKAVQKKRDYPTLVIDSQDGKIAYSHPGTGTHNDKFFGVLKSFHGQTLESTLLESLGETDKKRLNNWLELLYDEVYVELMLHEDIMKMVPSFSLTWSNGLNYEVRFDTIKTEKIYEFVLVWLEPHGESQEQQLAVKIIELMRDLRKLPNEVINNLREYLPEVKENLNLAKYADLADSPELFNKLSRHLHAAKGTVYFLGLSILGEAFHEAESNLLELKQHWQPDDGLQPVKDTFNQLFLLMTLTDGIITRVYNSHAQEQGEATLTVQLKAFYELLGFMDQLLDQIAQIQNPPKLITQLMDQVYRGLLQFDQTPISTLFERLNSSTAQLSKELKKQVTFGIKSQSVMVSMPNRVFDSLWNATYQVLKNAIDHGIEPKAKRESLGKAATAQIQLGIQTQGDWLRLIIRDDGQGINPSFILEHALNRNLIDQQQLERLQSQADQTEIFNLIFLPGFSTKETTSTVSGRGVGTDVIKKEVETYGGSISVASQIGEWTEFQLSFPMQRNHIVVDK